jgi:putative FmdB family regulatory protein
LQKYVYVLAIGERGLPKWGEGRAIPRDRLSCSPMPIYEYECKKCGKTIEVIQKMSDAPLKKHAGCGGTLTKLISAAGFQFKGTGWYVTDYARKGTESKESKETKDSSSNGSSKEASSGSDSKSSEKAGKKE